MFQTRCWATAAAAVVSIGWPGVAAAATLNVPGDFATIQACIDAAVSGVDECLVAPGTYHETINFLGKAVTVRSSGGADVTTIDATGIGGSVVTCSRGEGPDTVLNGFTITGGMGTDAGGYTRGGGMYNDHSSPTVTNCTLTGNVASATGGGMYNNSSSPTVTNCTFSRNEASHGGGAMYTDGLSSPTILGCIFIENAARWGGGIEVSGTSVVVISSSFNANRAASSGGAIYMRGASNVSVSNSAFNGNEAGEGGAVGSCGRSLTLENCTFAGNGADYNGGAVSSWMTRETIATGCTFSGNTAAGSGGGMYLLIHGATVDNCIFWANTAVRGKQIYDDLTGVTTSVAYTDVQGGWLGTGNISTDPMFVRNPSDGGNGWGDDPATPDVDEGASDDYGDLRVRGGSPCIDAGDPGFVAQPGETDLDGHARVLCGRVDMGAYEFGIGDYDCDQTVDLADFSSWQACMTGPSTADTAVPHAPGCEGFDFDGDGDVDLLDFGGFQRIVGP